MKMFRINERSMCQRDASCRIVEIHSVTAENQECAGSEGAIAFRVLESLSCEPPCGLGVGLNRPAKQQRLRSAGSGDAGAKQFVEHSGRGGDVEIDQGLGGRKHSVLPSLDVRRRREPHRLFRKLGRGIGRAASASVCGCAI
jgi:hypothetical protein